ncbi:hypothetical protein GW17_00032074, partial [Ensete ventricosum]
LHLNLGLTRQPIRADVADSRHGSTFMDIVDSPGRGVLRATARGKEPVALTEEDSFPVYRRPKLMKDLCGTRVCMDDEGYYVLQMAYWTPKDPAAAMRARWSNLSYTAKVWDDSQVASKFGRGVLHPTLAKDLYTLPSEILMAQATKQIALVSYVMGFTIFDLLYLYFFNTLFYFAGASLSNGLLDRVHDAGRLVTIMGNWASLLEAKIDKLKMEGTPSS